MCHPYSFVVGVNYGTIVFCKCHDHMNDMLLEINLLIIVVPPWDKGNYVRYVLARWISIRSGSVAPL